MGCTIMPSLVNSAFMACIFALLEIVWMLFTFYGVRRLGGNLGRTVHAHALPPGPWALAKGALGGKMALTIVMISHLLASFATVANRSFQTDGCMVALPLLMVILGVTVCFFAYYCKDSYLPMGQRRIRNNPHVE